MHGRMMHFPLTLTHLLGRAATSSPTRDRLAPPGRTFTADVRETLRRARQLAVRCAARRQARRPRRDPRWNHNSTSRPTSASRAAARPAHAQPAPAPDELGCIAKHAGDRW